MVTQKNTPWNNQTEYYGLSGDSKPSGVRNGDKFVEINTGKTFLYNETGAAWVEQPASGGGGGGGSSDFSTCTLTLYNSKEESYSYTAIVSSIEQYSSGGIAYNYTTAATHMVAYGTPTTISLPLYKGIYYLPWDCIGEFDDIVDPILSGSIQEVGAQGGAIDGFFITGNASLTLAGYDDSPV